MVPQGGGRIELGEQPCKPTCAELTICSNKKGGWVWIKLLLTTTDHGQAQSEEFPRQFC